MDSFPFTRRRALLGALALAAALVVGGRFVLGAGTAATPRRIPLPTARSSPQPKLIVDVVGAVRRPGLYRLAQGSRIADAVARAGGPTRKADLEQLNVAAPLADGEQVLVPRRAAAGAPGVGSPGSSAAPAGPVHLNTATLEQLDALPGVGPVTAQKILDYRAQHGAFGSVDELDAIPGIGPARLDQLRGLVAP